MSERDLALLEYVAIRNETKVDYKVWEELNNIGAIGFHDFPDIADLKRISEEYYTRLSGRTSLLVDDAVGSSPKVKEAALRYAEFADRGRNLDHADPAHVDRRRKTGEVARHAAAQCDDDALAVEPAPRRLAAEPGGGSEGLGLFARRENDRVGEPHRLGHDGGAAVGHGHRTAARQQGGKFGPEFRRAADENIVGKAAGKRHRNFFHRARPQFSGETKYAIK